MASILVTKLDLSAFDFQKIVGLLKSMEDSVSDVIVSLNSLSFDFDHGGDSVLVELVSEGKALATSDDGPAALEFAVRWQKMYGDPLRVFDESYGFDLELSGFDSADSLARAMVAGE